MPAVDGRIDSTSSAWILTDYLGEPAESFEELYPDCLPSAELVQSDATDLLKATLEFDVKNIDSVNSGIYWLTWFSGDVNGDGAGFYGP